MNTEQKLTPKYWVGHDKNTDDVFITTARKSWFECDEAMAELFDDNWLNREELSIILVEIKQVEIDLGG